MVVSSLLIKLSAKLLKIAAGAMMKKIIVAIIAMIAMPLCGAVEAACNADVVITKADNIYAVHGDGTVTDLETGLMWQQCSLGQSGSACTGTALSYTWKAALEEAQAANVGAGSFGYTDWRLPSVAELQTLNEKACYSPAINITAFPATVSNAYWSGSPYVLDAVMAWIIHFNLGTEHVSQKGNAFNVRLVRGGQ